MIAGMSLSAWHKLHVVPYTPTFCMVTLPSAIKNASNAAQLDMKRTIRDCLTWPLDTVKQVVVHLSR